MASLTHVCMWSETGWKNITAEEAGKLHPGGTVHSQSGLFMCDLCGQYVLLTDGRKNARHFRHSSEEASKDCPERIIGPSVTRTYSPREHDLPIRLRLLSVTKLTLELGFIRIPNELYEKKMKIMVSTAQGAEKFLFSGERIDPEGLTFVPLGENPSREYYLFVMGGDNRLYNYWPRVVKGINPAGTVFDASRGVKLPLDADVLVGKDYYILLEGQLLYPSEHVEAEMVCVCKMAYSTWHVYRVLAKDYDESAARFFLKFHCRLTEREVALVPVWPLYVETPFVFSHNEEETFLFLQGNADLHVFPQANVSLYPVVESKVFKLRSGGREQMISAGRNSSLQYTYFIKKALTEETEAPKVKVLDTKGRELAGGLMLKLPEEKRFKILSPYDGAAELWSRGHLLDRIYLSAGVATAISGLSMNQEIRIYVGLDLAWTCYFAKTEDALSDGVRRAGEETKEGKSKKEVEEALLQRLLHARGEEIPASHQLGAMAVSLRDYPRVRRWIYGCMRSNCIRKGALRELERFVREEKERPSR